MSAKPAMPRDTMNRPRETILRVPQTAAMLALRGATMSITTAEGIMRRPASRGLWP